MDLREYGNYPDLSGVGKVLVVIFKNIGDVVLSSPVFGVLKKSLPGAAIDAVVNRGTEEMLTGNPDIRRIHVLDRRAVKGGFVSRLRNEYEFIRSIRSEDYDLSIVLSPGDRGKYLGLFSGAEIRVGVASGKTSLLHIELLTIPVRQAPAHRHYVERNLDCLRRIGIFPENGMKTPVFYEGEDAASKTRTLLSERGIRGDEPYVLFHPTSRWMFKCWHYEKAAALVDRIQNELGVRVVLTSGPEELELSFMKRITELLKSDAVDLSGVLSLRELGALIRGAKLFVGVDSAPMHIAAAVRTPAVALFGPTSEMDWGPYGEGHRVITSDAFSCRPCNRDGCGGSKRSECMERIDVETVFNSVKSLMDSGSTS